MFSTLLETRALRSRRTGGTLMSMVVHGGFIAAAVALTLPSRGDATPDDRAEKPVVYVAVKLPERPSTHAPSPVSTPVPQPSTPLPTIAVPTIVPTTIPPITVGAQIAPERIVIGGPGSRIAAPSGEVVGGSGTGGGIVESALADVIPRVLGNAPEPRYPQLLSSSGLAGRVLIQFVVDTTGRAEAEGVKVLETTHELFADAVRQTLPRYRFTPGESHGRRVRVLVQMPFLFSLR